VSLIITSDESISIDKNLEDRLHKIVELILIEEDSRNSEINLRLMNNKEMQALNAEFRNKDRPTNVLSFPNEDISSKFTNNLGDIAISCEYVEKEAEDEGKTFDEHIIHMLAHGVYHILGYDHINNELAMIMEKKEINILKKIIINNPY
jgi:probable rRNA maturation factor